MGEKEAVFVAVIFFMHFKIKTGHSISNEAEIKLEILPQVPQVERN